MRANFSEEYANFDRWPRILLVYYSMVEEIRMVRVTLYNRPGVKVDTFDGSNFGNLRYFRRYKQLELKNFEIAALPSFVIGFRRTVEYIDIL